MRHKRKFVEDEDYTEALSSAELPSPSEEQRAVIDAVNSGFCVTIPSVAGSGKTTCMLQIIASLPPHRRAIIVSYNRGLCDECKLRIDALGLQHRVKA